MMLVIAHTENDPGSSAEGASVLRQRWARLAYGAFVMVAVGFVYGWSIFSEPFKMEFGWDAQTLSLNFSILMLCFCLGGLLGARINAWRSTRIALLVCVVGICVGFLGALLVRQDTPWVLYITYAVFGGLTSGITYNTMMSALVPWFPDRTGVVSGILLMSYSCATMLLGTLAAYLFATVGWRTTFIAFAIAISLVLLGGIPIARKPRTTELEAIGQVLRTQRDQRDQRDRRASRPERSGNAGRSLEPVHDYSTAQMLKTPVFYVYGVWMLLLSSMGLALTGHVNQIGLTAGLSTALAVAFVSLHSVSNAAGRLGMGAVFDALGPTTTMAATAGLQILGAVLIFLSLSFGSTALLVVALVCYSVGMGGVPIMGSSFMAKYFGPTHYGNNLAVLNLIIIPAGFIGPSLMSAFIMATGSYASAMLILTLFGIAALVCVLILRKMR